MSELCDNCGAPLSIGAGSAEVEIDDLKQQLTAAQTRIGELEAALRPFADVARAINPKVADHWCHHHDHFVGHYREAERVLLPPAKLARALAAVEELEARGEPLPLDSDKPSEPTPGDGEDETRCESED